MCKIPNIVLLNLLLLIFLIMPIAPASAEDSEQTMQVSCSGGSKTVTVVKIDLNEPGIGIESVFAKRQIGQTDNLQNIAEQMTGPNTEVVAAINAGFFDPTGKGRTQLWSTIQQKGEFVHLGNFGSVIGFTADNQVKIENLYILIKGAINGHWEEPFSWNAWGLNHAYTQPDAIAIFTPAYGASTGSHQRVSIMVENGQIIAIGKGEAAISKDGYTIVMDPNNYLLKRFKVGDKLDYKLEYYKSDFSNGLILDGPISWDGIQTTVGAGPTLLKDGEIVANGRAEGFFEAEVLDSPAIFRSFIGVNKEHELIMGVAKSVTIKEMAELCRNMGMNQAICLDGGISSSLYYHGSYMNGPFRKITDAIVITRHIKSSSPAPEHTNLRRLLLCGE